MTVNKRWLTLPELRSNAEELFGVSLTQLTSGMSTFSAWANLHRVRRGRFSYRSLPSKEQQACVQRVEQGRSDSYHQSASTVLKRCRFTYNVSDIKKLAQEVKEVQ
jgi:hypothetical protein